MIRIPDDYYVAPESDDYDEMQDAIDKEMEEYTDRIREEWDE